MYTFASLVIWFPLNLYISDTCLGTHISKFKFYFIYLIFCRFATVRETCAQALVHESLNILVGNSPFL